MVKMHDSSVVRLALITTFVTVSAPWVSANAYPSFPKADALAKKANIRIQGSPNIEPLSRSLKQGFEKQYSGAQVTVTNSSTKAALDAVKSGKADMAAIGRPLSDAEKAQGLVAIPIGREKIAVVVGKNNPFNKDLTIPNFAKAFRGEIKDWSEIGGKKGGLQFIDRTETDTRKAFPNYPAFQGKTFDSGSTGLKLADENPDKLSGKLGDRGISFLPASVAVNQTNLRVLTMHGVKPTDARYPFSQPLYYVYKGEKPNDAVKAFLGYAGSNAGQAAVTGAGIAKAINFNDAAAAAAADQDAKAGAAAIAQAEKTVDQSGAKDVAGKEAQAGGDQSATMKTQTADKEKVGVAGGEATGKSTDKSTGKPDGAKAGGNVASNQIAIGDEVGGRIPSWLWWLLLPLGLLGLLLWLLPKDEEEEPIRPVTGSRPMRGTAIGNPLPGAGEAIGGAVDAAGDAAGRTAGAVGDVAGRTAGAVGDAAKTGGAAAAGLGAAAVGLGAAAFGKLKGNRNDTSESEWEPGSEPDEFKIETPDWNLDEGDDRSSSNWLQTAKDRVSDAVDGARDAAGNVVDQAGDLAGGAKDKAGDALNAGGATIAGAGAAAAGVGAAAWSAISGRKEPEPGSPKIDLSLPTPESTWEFEGGELPDATIDPSPRMADYADGGSGANLLDRARGAASGAINRVKTGVGDATDGATDLAGNAVGQVKSTTSKLGSAAEGSTSWLNKWLGKGKDAVEDATSSAAGAADRVKDSIANTGAAAMAAGGAAVAGTAAAVGSGFSGAARVVMVPYNSREALVRWELDARAQEQMRGQGGNQLVLRLYDVTDMDATSKDLPTFEQFDVDEAKQEQRILIPQRNRKYISVLGYLTRAGGFLEIARSAEVQIPSA